MVFGDTGTCRHKILTSLKIILKLSLLELHIYNKKKWF